MANVINTRIQLKYDSYANWNTKNPTLLSGEIAIAYLSANGTPVTNDANVDPQQPILFKVGDGTHTFNQLPWVSGLAADVYAWAKKSTPDWNDFPALPLEVIDNGTGKFITDITYADNKLTITRDDAVNSLTETDDGVVILTVDKSKGDVTITGEHKEYGEANSTTDTNSNATTAGATATIKVPTLTVDKYGHTVMSGETTHTITIPNKVAVGDGNITIKGGDGLTGEETFNVNTDGDATITIAHDNTSDVENVTGEHFKFISGLTFDEFGHVTATNTHTLDFGVSPAAADQAMIRLICDNLGAAEPKSIYIEGDGATSVSVSENTLIISSTDENDAHTHADGKGIKANGTGGLTGETTFDLNVAFELVDKEIRLYDKDDTTKAALATLDATSFIKDGMISSVAISEDGTKLVITWNTDAGKEAVNIPLTELVDVMTGVDGTTIKVEVSADDKISAEVKTGSLKDGHIATDAAIAETKLHQNAQDALALARTAVQPIALSNYYTADETNNYFKRKQDAVADQALSGATVVKGIAQDESGKITVSTRDLTPADIGAQPVGNYKVKQDILEFVPELTTLPYLVTKVSQNKNGEIDVEYNHLEHELMSVGNTGYASIGLSMGGGSPDEVALKGDDYIVTSAAGNNELNIKATEKLSDAVALAETAIQPTDLHEIATTGSIYDVKEGSNTTATDGVEYLIFNCGSATTLID